MKMIIIIQQKKKKSLKMTPHICTSLVIPILFNRSVIVVGAQLKPSSEWGQSQVLVKGELGPLVR